MPGASDRVEALVESEDWKGARRAIRGALRKRPESHWLLSRLALTYYEELDYGEALEYDSRALGLSPDCPLALWGHAGALNLLGRQREALRIYSRLIGRGVESIAYGECGEGLAWARGLVADCFYRMAKCYKSLGRRKRAVELYEKHLAQRGPGCRSIYPVRKVRKELLSLKEQSPLRNSTIRESSRGG